jgi:predicted RNase H-like HicB family nuclease
MRQSIRAFIRRGDQQYVAEGIDIAVVAQGKTLDETVANLKEAILLHLDGEGPADFDLVPHPSLVVTLEPEPLSIAWAGANPYHEC